MQASIINYTIPVKSKQIVKQSEPSQRVIIDDFDQTDTSEISVKITQSISIKKPIDIKKENIKSPVFG